MILFKEKLLQSFPDWRTLVGHKEVIRFACGLTAETQTILKFVYEMVLHDLVESETPDEDIVGFLESIWKEVSEKGTTHPPA